LHRIAALFESVLEVLEDAFQTKCVAQFQGVPVDQKSHAASLW
jgi:hypothetical protein